ncbi:MAG TPA: hypothetical protein VGH38_38065, partial [Bryobacteraceae bacterium]
MKKLIEKFASFSLIAIALMVVVPAPVSRAQNLGGTVRISTKPDGAYYSVDGQVYTHATAAIWPAGSKHILSADLTENGVVNKAHYTFGGWKSGSGELPGGNTITVTADPSVSDYTGVFTVEYALSLAFFGCVDATHCS